MGFFGESRTNGSISLVCMCFDTHTEAGRVQKYSTTIEFLKAAAGSYFVTEYKKMSKAGYKLSQSNIMHMSGKFHFYLFFFCLCLTG